MTTPPADRPPKADIDTSPTLLLAGLFAARRSGDAILARVYLRRLADLGIHIGFVGQDPPRGGAADRPRTDTPQAGGAE